MPQPLRDGLLGSIAGNGVACAGATEGRVEGKNSVTVTQPLKRVPHYMDLRDKDEY